MLRPRTKASGKICTRPSGGPGKPSPKTQGALAMPCANATWTPACVRQGVESEGTQHAEETDLPLSG
ncbi:hypothetical protein PRBEI_2001266000 [Prionailurus iriomotensis]